MRVLVSPKQSMPVFIFLTAVVHFAIQFLSRVFYSSEIAILGGLVYVLGGGLDLLVAAHLFRKALVEKSQQSLLMGIGMMLLGVTFLITGLGLVGLFGSDASVNANLGMYLLISGVGMGSLFFLLSPSNARLKSGAHWIIVALVWMIVFLVGLYQFHDQLPQLFEAGLPTLLRQQLITGVIFLLFGSAFRLALATKTSGPLTTSVQWYVVGISVLSLMMLDFLLSNRPGDEYSWAGRFFHVLASGAFIQYLWWDEQEM